jgi:putative oxidoreductase
MKRIFKVNEASDSTSVALLLARIGIAALMLTHGLPKLAMLLSGAPVQFPPVLGMSAELALALTVFAEVVCSVLILAGFATRLATVPLIITMLVAVFVIHAADPFAKQEPALYYLLVYVVLLIAGSGKYSIDYLLQRNTQTTGYTSRKVQDPALAVYK